MPRTPGGQTMPVGMELDELHVEQFGAGRRYAIAAPSPVLSQEFDVTLYMRPQPPLAMTTAFARKTTNPPLLRL